MEFVLNRKKKKIPNIDFDLSQNILFYKNLVRLDHPSFVIFSSYYLKKLNIFEALGEIDFEMEDILSDNNVISVIENFVTKIQRNISKDFGIKLKLLDTYVKSSIFLVIERTVSFFQVAKIYLLKEQQLFVKNFVFTSHGTVNTKMTLVQVLDNENLREYRKFKLAAHFFLGKQIVRYYYSLLTKEEKDSLSNVDIDDDFACYYWVWQIKGSRAPIKNFLSYYWDRLMSVKECRLDVQKSEFAIQNIFERAVKNHNEIAVQYLWVNHVSNLNERELILKHSILSYKEKASHINIIMYLISQAEEEELIGFFHSDRYKNLMLFYTNKRWKFLFFDVLNTLSANFVGQDYFYILQNIAATYRSKNSSEVDLNFLCIFFQKIPVDKRNMLGNFDCSWEVYYELLRVVFNDANVPMVVVILEYCSRLKVFDFFLTSFGMDLLEISIKKSCYKFVNKILYAYLYKFQIDRVKSEFFRVKGFDVCYALLFVGVSEMNRFMNWLSDSVSSEDLVEFSRQLIFMNNGKFVKDLLFSLNISTINPFSYSDEILEWCVGHKGTNMIKSFISLHMQEEESLQGSVIKCYDNVSKLVLESDWKFLNELIRWKKCTTKDRIDLGRKLLVDWSLFEQILKKKNCLNFIYEFSNWVIKDLYIQEQDDNLRNFKTNVFKNIKLILSLLIMNLDLDEIKKTLIWCKAPISEVRSLRKDIHYMLQSFKTNTEEAQRELDEFYNWFNSL
ncbi:UNVERIFIED_CONTAM: hypothetical protein RMT77_019330 [Armadillidium vulgare]